MSQGNIPKHIAIIMDGNGRWAKKRGLPRNEGHRKGAKGLETILKYAEKLGVEYLTVYAFSTENWNRSKSEVEGLMQLFERYLNNSIKKTKDNGQKFRVIGNVDSDIVPASVKEKIKKLEDITKNNSGICFNMAFNYGGRDEIIRACKKLAKDIENKKLSSELIDENIFNQYLDTKDIPDPDLMIRTSGEIRTSNFLPWQLTYSEFYFTECLWPDFNEKELDKAIEVFGERQRRFGKSE